MKRESIKLFSKEEYAYSLGDFTPTINAYLHENNKKRKAIIVVAGGAYAMVSAVEAHNTAMEYFKRDFQVYVLTYTINPFGKSKPIGKQPLFDLSRAVCEVRNRAEIDGVDENKIIAVGFSAGGHLISSYGVHDINAFKAERDKAVSNKLNAIILAYPVISAELKTNDVALMCFKNLFGEEITKQQLEFCSNHKHISVDTPPSFIWHAIADSSVPVENSIVFANACIENKVPCELHLFAKGEHGIATANAGADNDEIGDCQYTMEQLYFGVKEILKTNREAVSEIYIELFENATFEEFLSNIYKLKSKVNTFDKKDEYIAKWVDLSIGFVEKQLDS